MVDRSLLRRTLHTGLENVVRFGVRVTGHHHSPDTGITSLCTSPTDTAPTPTYS
ncbi:hypothetical protein [Streptomyces sp. MMG1121]|uniref:hypothetical protein n=1 Tax=Streptomyces sp. MMG1121 TaxID=1415544 RepID=UPI000A9E6CD0|nr:hypothetical protein [Streptomyces sp. MMG1121]